MEGSDVWHHPPPMNRCKPDKCTHAGRYINIKLTASSKSVKYVII